MRMFVCLNYVMSLTVIKFLEIVKFPKSKFKKNWIQRELTELQSPWDQCSQDQHYIQDKQFFRI